MTDLDWTGEATIRLMEEYKQRPELWDSTHDLYRVQTAKYEAWSDLARVFDCDIADLRKKLNSIFASHRREKAKIRGGGRSTWFLYNCCSFLPSHLENNNTATVTLRTKNKEQSDESEQSSNDQDNEVFIKQEPDYPKDITVPKFHRPGRLTRPFLKRRITKEKVTPSITSTSSTTSTANTTTTSQLDSRLLETLKLLRKSELVKKRDECDTFGEYIAVSLRKHDERTQSMIKQAINNILFEQEMKKYSAGQYTVVISGVDDNPLVLSDEK